MLINESGIAIIRRSIAEYPKKTDYFRPHLIYPEYPFPGEISKEINEIYDMVRECLIKMQLDLEHYNTKEWNPLGEYITPGDKVLLKPNLVLEINYNLAAGIECVYTHPAITAAVIDYVVIALQGKGEIIIADAPVQHCRLEKLVEESGYKALIQWYAERNVAIKLIDLRSGSNKVDCDGWIQKRQNRSISENGVLVSLDEKSAFCGLPEDILQRMRVMNFDPRIMKRNHTGNKHRYMIAKEVLEADVIINLPKPKTHRIAGITGAQKNLIGTCANKDYLPHYTLGGKEVQGDSYLHGNFWLDAADKLMDIKNILNREGQFEKARRAAELYEMVSLEGHSKRHSEWYTFGGWYGNDTLWRTIADINRIIVYADKNGLLQDIPQRKMFIVADMIVAGEKEGPLSPSAHKAGVIIAGQDPLAFDRVLCALMGFDEEKVPQLMTKKMQKFYRSFRMIQKPVVLSNISMWHKVAISDMKHRSLKFIPSKDWEYTLGNPKKNEIFQKCLKKNKHIIIFGAGINGIRTYLYIKKWYHDIVVKCFWDNSQDKQGKIIVDEIKCSVPDSAKTGEICIISVRNNFLAEIYIEVKERGFDDKDIIIFSDDFIGDGNSYKKEVSHL